MTQMSQQQPESVTRPQVKTQSTIKEAASLIGLAHDNDKQANCHPSHPQCPFGEHLELLATTLCFWFSKTNWLFYEGKERKGKFNDEVQLTLAQKIIPHGFADQTCQGATSGTGGTATYTGQ